MNKAIKSTIIFLSIIWGVFLINFIIPGIDLRSFGIKPRTLQGLLGIIFSPFLHGSWGHITSNSIPMLFLTPMLFYFYPKTKYAVITGIILIGGFIVWLIGAENSVHIGASGLIFGLISFLITAGIIKLNWKTILLSIIVSVFYGGAMLQGFVPQEGISWEGHLFGAVAGIFMAWILRKDLRKNVSLK